MFNIMREMQDKASLRFCLSVVRMAYINKTNYSLCWWGCGERGTLIQFWCEYKHVHSLWKLLKWLIRTLRIVLYQGLAITIFGIYSNGCFILLYPAIFNNILLQRHLFSHVHNCYIHNSQKLEAFYRFLN